MWVMGIHFLKKSRMEGMMEILDSALAVDESMLDEISID